MRRLLRLTHRIYPSSLLSFLSAVKYSHILFSTGSFSSGQVVICSQCFFYDAATDPCMTSRYTVCSLWIRDD